MLKYFVISYKAFVNPALSNKQQGDGKKERPCYIYIKGVSALNSSGRNLSSLRLVFHVKVWPGMNVLQHYNGLNGIFACVGWRYQREFLLLSVLWDTKLHSPMIGELQ